MDKLQAWRYSQTHKPLPLPFHQQRTLEYLKKTRPSCEKMNDGKSTK